jgi:hypothetical protein
MSIIGLMKSNAKYLLTKKNGQDELTKICLKKTFSYKKNNNLNINIVHDRFKNSFLTIFYTQTW